MCKVLENFKYIHIFLFKDLFMTYDILQIELMVCPTHKKTSPHEGVYS